MAFGQFITFLEIALTNDVGKLWDMHALMKRSAAQWKKQKTGKSFKRD
jgi:hypothetical protein